MRRSKIYLKCADCKEIVLFGSKDYFMVNNDVWEKYGVRQELLCVGCFEKRMGRKLRYDDLTLCLLNIINPYTRGIIKNFILDYERKLELGVQQSLTQKNTNN